MSDTAPMTPAERAAHVAGLRRLRADPENLDAGQRSDLELADREYGDGWWLSVAEIRLSRGLAALDAFIAREGHTKVPGTHIEGGFPLGTWTGNLRQAFKNGKLSPERVADLDSRAVWAWSIFGQRNDVALRALDAFIAREGHARVEFRHFEDGVSLGRWAAGRRSDFAAGRLSPERIADLNSRAGWSWNPIGDMYADGLDALDSFILREGHSLVPARYFEGAYSLGRWVSNRRHDFAIGRLSPERVSDLNSRAGWSWNPIEHMHASGLDALDRFVERVGHGRVSYDHVEDGFRLGEWVSNRRNDFKASRLSPERVSDLNSRAGWSWNPIEHKHASGLDALDKFISREGHARVGSRHVEGDFPLGSWVSNRRSDFKAGRLSAARIADLNSRAEWLWRL